jgi:hypothetical protein
VLLGNAVCDHFLISFWRAAGIEFSLISLRVGSFGSVRHVTGTGSGMLGGIPRVVVQISALTLKGPP